MYLRDYKDILGGAALIAIGAFATIYAVSSLNLGSMTRMGPGMFPAVLGVIQVAIGLALLIPALSRPGRPLKVEVRPLLAILASILAFALTVRPFGLVPAVFAVTVVASLADSKLSPRGLLALAASLSVIAVLIFRVGLGIPLAVVAWPW